MLTLLVVASAGAAGYVRLCTKLTTADKPASGESE